MMKAGNLFSIITIYHPGSIVEFESTTNQEFECITFQDDPVITSSSYNEIVFSLARNSENPDKAIEVLDYIYGSPELMNLLNWGEEGTDYVIEDKENGIINYPEGKNADSVGYSMNSGWELPNQFIAYKWHGSEPDLWEQLEDFNNNAKESKAAGFTFDNTEYADQLSALNNVVSQYGGSLLSGTGDPDTYISKFLKALKDAGIDDVIDGKKKQLDIWIEKQK
jgi:putative aldouronate transport system substrate-binding protein